MTDPLAHFHPAVQRWFSTALGAPTRVQALGWPAIASGRSSLLLAPTGSGKTLAAFLAAIDRLMFSPRDATSPTAGTRIVYVSPLKALGVDVEKNLRVPLAGISAEAAAAKAPYVEPVIGVRSGDTPASERARAKRAPPDILITTPESLYLLLTSSAAATLTAVETVIVDEIHSLVPTKRGAHLFLSLERLEALVGRPLQRIGLSATQRPLEEIARLLGGGRPVELVDAGEKKPIEVSVELPGELIEGSVWPSIHPRLVELVRAHRSTIIFANSRRLAERLAAAINDTAHEELARAHHGSLARESRLEIEERLKSGTLPAIVATSSLELGIDMGAVDLVVQIEAPPSVAAGIQRIGRASHSVGGVSRGVIFPKYRGDLLACAAATARMKAGAVEETYYPRNPLDVLAQQIVAIAAMEPVAVDQLFALVRRAAPYASLTRTTFESVLDMLSGRYPSDEFAELKPRLTWDRVQGVVRAREGAKKTAVVNAGTIPDRGLYGVFLAESDAKSRRVGELDEEMVFESRIGDVFILGASSWRITDITDDRVLVVPAPGEPGRMPFWHGDRPGRPLELGKAIGALARSLLDMSRDAALAKLRDQHGLEARSAEMLIDYLVAQHEATGEVPSDRAIVVERTRDEHGHWRVCVLAPFGMRVHAPWATAVHARLAEDIVEDVDVMWSDDGIVFRLPESDESPELEMFIPKSEEIEEQVSKSLGDTSLFAARFREAASRALLLPRRYPGKRSPLWAQRKRARDLLSVASQFESFPMILETYRECLRDVFDLPALVEVLRAKERGEIHVVGVVSRTPSPFASSLMFSYVSNFIYEGDAPSAERRAQVLSVDQAQLRELLGEVELREMLDPEAIEAHVRVLQRLDERMQARNADGVHDLLRWLGELTREELRARSAAGVELDAVLRDGRAFEVSIAGELRIAAVEDAGKLRDALGAVVPKSLPAVFLEAVPDALDRLVARYARTHGPFRSEQIAARFGATHDSVRSALQRLAARGKVVESDHDWFDAEVLRALKGRSLAKLRREVEPVDHAALGRFALAWHDVARKRKGLEALLSVIEKLEGAAIPYSVLEREVFPARIENYRPADLDTLASAGEVVWRGVEPLGSDDGRIALYLTDRYRLLAPPPKAAEGDLALRVRALLEARGALFYSDLSKQTGAFPADLLAALWSLVWAGEVTNDTFTPLRAKKLRAAFRSRRSSGPAGSEGRWSLLPRERIGTDTERLAATTNLLLARHGVLTREAVANENPSGGFSTYYPVLRAMEEAGKLRRGYFVAGLGATQFAKPGAEERLRALRDRPAAPEIQVLAATDPANIYGAAVPWPEGQLRPGRTAGAQVILLDGALIAYAGKTERNLLTFLPADEPARSEAAKAIAGALASLVERGKRRAVLIDRIDGTEAHKSSLATFLKEAGFSETSRGFLKRASLSATALRST